MDSPFFRSLVNQSSLPVRGIPVQPDHRKSSPKVVSIPVHFVVSESTQKASETTRTGSALKIQKVFKGFLVRKSVKRIASIRNEVNEIERRISNCETIGLIRRDTKERLRVNETLMTLLFKLDSIRGVDSGVRDFRKAVIKKAIALQEKVDAIVAADHQTIGTASNDSGTLREAVNRAIEMKDSAGCLIDSENATDQTLDSQGKTMEPLDLNSDFVPVDFSSGNIPEAGGIDENPELGCLDESIHNQGILEAREEGPEFGVDSEVNADEDNCVVKEIVENFDTAKSLSGCVGGTVETGPTEDCSANCWSLIESEKENASEEEGDGKEVQKHEWGERDDQKRNRELLEKMMEDNEKMMSLMKQIFDRNEMQTRMLNSLARRVEQLEKAFACDKLRRKKKRHDAS